MTKDIKQIQEHNRKAIICAVHGTDDYEEALEREAKIHFLDDSDGPFGYGQWITIREGYIYKSYPDAEDDYVEEDFLDSIDDFASKLTTLDRVLLVLQSQEVGFLNGFLFELEDAGYNGMMERWICKWNLSKRTLEEQTEETQIAIAELLGYEKHND